jgi:hypothetical protein
VPTVERFEDLRVWQEAREIVALVYRLTRGFPTHERYGLAGQMQRAVRSQAYVALDLGYISQPECDGIVQRCETLSRRLYNFIEYLKHTPFQGPKLRESGPEWHIDEPET